MIALSILRLEELIFHLDEFLTGKTPFFPIRRFVYQFVEAEDDLELDCRLSEVFPALLPYLQYEESEGDPDLNVRMQRLRNTLLSVNSFYKEATVYALEYDAMFKLKSKYDTGIITKDTYHEQLKKLSPVEYDINRLMEMKSEKGA